MSFQPLGAWRLRKVFCIGIACLGLQYEVCFATSIVAPFCIPHVPRRLDDKGRVEGKAEYLSRILADGSNEPVCLGREVSSSLGAEGVDGLLDILRSDQSSSLRAKAGQVLAAVSVNVGKVSVALIENLDMEKDEKVFLARLESFASLVGAPLAFNGEEFNTLLEKLERASRAEIVATIDHHDEERASQGIARALRSLDRVLALDHAEKPNARMDIQSRVRLWNRLLSAEARVILRKETQDPYQDVWRAPLFESLQSALDTGRVAAEPQARTAMVDSLVSLVGSGDSEVRLAGYGLLGSLLAVPPASKPELPDAQVDALCAVSTAAMNDPDARIRAQAIKLLGQLAGMRNDLIPLLVRALEDSDDQVRRQAADSLRLIGAVPDAALAPLYTMAKKVQADSVSAIRALSLRPTPETLNFLLGLIIADDVPGSLGPNQSYRDTEDLIMARDLVEVEALERFGEQAILPLAALADRATKLRSQGKLYLALNKLGWLKQGAEHSSALESALAPALDGDNESSRQFAMSLLAHLRPYAGANYSSQRSEQLARRYLRRTVAVQSELEWFASDRAPLTPNWNSDWLVVPDVAAAIVAGNSESSVAAEAMTNWLCMKRRDIRAESDVTQSLKNMGAVAALPVLAAVSKEKSKRCRFDLLIVLSRIDTGSDLDAAVAMARSLPKADSPMRRALLVSLARSMPALPPESLANLVAVEKGKDPVQSLLARWVIDGRSNSRVPPSDLTFAKSIKKEDENMRESARQWLQWRRGQLDGPEPYTRLEAAELAGDLGDYGVDTIAMLTPILLADDAVLVREAAAEALGRIGSPEALPALEKAQQSGLPKVAKRAAWAINRISRFGTADR